MRIVKVRDLPVVSTCWETAVLDDKDTSKVKFIVKMWPGKLTQKPDASVHKLLIKEIQKKLHTKEAIKLRHFKDRKSKVFPELNKEKGGALLATSSLLPKFSNYFSKEALALFEKKKSKKLKIKHKGLEIKCSFLGVRTRESNFKKDLERFANDINKLVLTDSVIKVLAAPLAMEMCNMEGTGEPMFCLLFYCFIQPIDNDDKIVKKYRFDEGDCPKEKR